MRIEKLTYLKTFWYSCMSVLHASMYGDTWLFMKSAPIPSLATILIPRISRNQRIHEKQP